MGAHDTGNLAQPAGDQSELVVWNAEDVDGDVKNVVDAEFGGNPPRHYVKILKPLNDAGERMRIGVRHDLQSQ
jgi:hypothetical protein